MPYTVTADPNWLQSPDGKLIPREAVDPHDIVGQTPLDTRTPTVADAAGAPKIDDARIDAVVGKLDAVKQTMGELGAASRQFSVAGAQGAAQSAGIASQALGMARSGPPGTSATALSQAMSQGGAAEGQANRTATMARAGEEDQDQRFKLAAYSAAAKLGLAQAGLDVKIEQANVASATNYLNQLFQLNGIKQEVNEQEAESMLRFAKDLMTLDVKKYGLDQRRQNDLEDRLLDRERISSATRNKLKLLKEAKGQTALGILGPAIQAGASAYARGAFDSGGEPSSSVYDIESSQTQAAAPADASGGAGGYQGGR